MQNFVKITLVLIEITTEMTEILIEIVNRDARWFSKTAFSFCFLLQLVLLRTNLELEKNLVVYGFNVPTIFSTEQV